MELNDQINELQQTKQNEFNEEDDAKQITPQNDITFIDFSDEVHEVQTYNIMENNKCIEPIFDEKEFEEFNIGNDEEKKQMFGYDMMYRSFIIVDVSCLCYLAYSYYHGSSFQRAQQIRQKYRKWQNSLNMKKRMTKTQKLRK